MPGFGATTLTVALCGACVQDPGYWGPLLSCPSAWVKTSLLSGLWNDRGCLRGDLLPG